MRFWFDTFAVQAALVDHHQEELRGESMTDFVGLGVEVISDGRTVWINGPEGAIGRFGRMGTDVHYPDTTGCLYCTHGPQDEGDWWMFQTAMVLRHGVVVGDEHRPGWLDR